MQSIADLRAACAALPHSQETFPFDMTTLVFKVGGKMYALTDITAESPSLSLKVKPQRGDELRAEYRSMTPGYHLNKRHWITVKLDGSVPDALLAELLRDSHALVVKGLTRSVRAELGGPVKVIIGAGEQRWDGWTATQQEQLDLTRPESFAAYFGNAKADAFLCEHVWEHLHPHEAQQAAKLVFAYLKPGGFLRVAVPDGHHPDPAYLALVAVHGPGPAADHRVLYTLETFRPVFQQAGFTVEPLEWWDGAHHFHQADWHAEAAPIYRSGKLDHRNQAWREGKAAPGFSSLILHAVKPPDLSDPLNHLA